jgi:hypothetical protein
MGYGRKTNAVLKQQYPRTIFSSTSKFPPKQFIALIIRFFMKRNKTTKAEEKWDIR